MRRPVLAAVAFVAGAAVWHHRERLNAALDPVVDAFEHAMWAAEERWPWITTALDSLFAIDDVETTGPADGQLYADDGVRLPWFGASELAYGNSGKSTNLGLFRQLVDALDEQGLSIEELSLKPGDSLPEFVDKISRIGRKPDVDE